MKDKIFDLRTPVHAAAGFVMGLTGLNPIGFIAMQLSMKIFSHTIAGSGKVESNLNLLGDVSSGFLSYLIGRGTRQEIYPEGPDVPPEPEIPLDPKEISSDVQFG